MGLDAVELVMETEDRFDTSIPDVFAERIQTVGDLHDFLMNRIRWRDSNRCTTAAMFYPIRKLLVAGYGVMRSDVRPNTQLTDLVAPPDRHRFWHDVQLQLLTTLPRLRRSKMLMWNGDLFPRDVASVGDLARTCADALQITRKYGASDDVAVWNELSQMIASIAGVAPDTLRAETHFNRDLGF
jgi:hypothetical protein